MYTLKGTRIIKIDPANIDKELIRLAANVIKDGGTVAFPTETVYGLGANALDSDAVIKIFKAKNRPMDNPIIVHIANRDTLNLLAVEVPDFVDKLIERFWPGPLTFILKASKIVPKVTTGGLDTIAIRMPNHKVALALIEESKVPLAAPSANLAGRPSPTSVEHVIEDLAGRIDLIIDSGPTNIGIESTVLDVSGDVPTILRPGGVTLEDLREVIREVKLHPAVTSKIEVERPLSPGMKYRHYAPKAEMLVVEGEELSVKEKVQEIVNKNVAIGKSVGILTFDENKGIYRNAIIKSLGSRQDLKSAAKRLFSLLREFDKEHVDLIVAEGVTEEGLGLALMNRLRKASGYRIVKV